MDPVQQQVDKYKGQPIRFEDKGDHYELIFTDEFNVPTSGTMVQGGKPYTLLTDVVTDMRNADHDKELHVFIASYGGEVHALCMIMQQMLEFRHRVAVNLGMADSCGWMLTFACQERYGSPFSDYMYHEMSGGSWGKTVEMRHQNDFAAKWWRELFDRTDTRNVLTEEELRLGETSEVWLTGAELIARGAIRDYSEYSKRIPVVRANDMYKVGDRIFRKEDDGYVEYVKAKDDFPYSWQKLVAFANKRESMNDGREPSNDGDAGAGDHSDADTSTTTAEEIQENDMARFCKWFLLDNRGNTIPVEKLPTTYRNWYSFKYEEMPESRPSSSEVLEGLAEYCKAMGIKLDPPSRGKVGRRVLRCVVVPVELGAIDVEAEQE
jgi:ATP-dependent protease ClpP protease subunit